MGALPPWISKWWDVANGRRFLLIKKKHEGAGITPAQEKELTMLQAVSDAIVSFASPPMKERLAELDKILEKFPHLKPPSPEAESLGRLARLDGHALTTNPFAQDTWLWKSWNGGWDQADKDPAAPKEALRT